MLHRQTLSTNLSEPTYYILLALLIPLHGYGIMQKVKRISAGQVTVGAGTVYGALDAMERGGWVQRVAEEGRRKIYLITDDGKKVLYNHLVHLQQMTQAGEMMLPMMETDGVA
jgi:DNA-binding PadR family transcriptional regulator